MQRTCRTCGTMHGSRPRSPASRDSRGCAKSPPQRGFSSIQSVRNNPGSTTQLSGCLTPERIEPVPRKTTTAGRSLHHPAQLFHGGTPMRKQTRNIESIPALNRPPLQKPRGPVLRRAGMNVYCGRCGTYGLIDYSTGFCLGCERQRQADNPVTMDPDI